jgi:hypothetical protein
VLIVLVGAWFFLAGSLARSTPNRPWDAALGSSSWMGNPAGRRHGGLATMIWGVILILFGIHILLSWPTV